MNIGNELQKAREEKGISIDELQKKTKIRKKYLIALENNKFSEIKGEVYVKSFIKGYARAVGINPAPFIYEYEQYIVKNDTDSKNDQNKNEYNQYKNSNKQRLFKNNKLKNIAIILFIIILLATIGFLIYRNFIVDSNNIIENTDIKEEVTLNNSINLNEIDNFSSNNNFNINDKKINSKESYELEENEITFDIPEKNENKNITSEKSQKEVIQNDKIGNKIETDEIETNNNSKNTNDNSNSNNNIEDDKNIEDDNKNKDENIPEEIDIKIIASQRTWLRVTLYNENNNEILFEGFMNPEEEENVTFNPDSSIKLRIGNGEGIYILEKEQEYGPWGERGEVLEKEITYKNELQIN